MIVQKANTPDTTFVEPAIQATIEVTGQVVEKVYADGAYQSPSNDVCCENIDMVFTGIQGAEPKYDLEMTPEGLLATDVKTGETLKAVLVKKQKNSKEDKWRIKTPTGYYYFGQQAIRASDMRRQLNNRPLEELHIRNNVEATVFQVSIPLRNNKSKYRGLIKQKIWTYCRCLWINLVRILNFTKQICQRTFISTKIVALASYSSCYNNLGVWLTPSWNRNIAMVLFLVVINNFYAFL